MFTGRLPGVFSANSVPDPDPPPTSSLPELHLFPPKHMHTCARLEWTSYRYLVRRSPVQKIGYYLPHRRKRFKTTRSKHTALVILV